MGFEGIKDPANRSVLGEFADASTGDDLVGQQIDRRYRIDHLLGTGGMGSVYAAEHLALHKKVAIKVIRKEFSANEEIAARFQREAMATAQLDHPHIASALDYGVLPDGHAFLVTQFVPGESLREILTTKGALDVATSLELAGQIADALAAAHSKSIVHRDLKPENILIEKKADGTLWARVLDFGIARVLENAPAPSTGMSRDSLTQIGAVIGTPGYMSPEQAMGETVDERTDLYALGVILWEMLTGRELFDELEFSKIVARQLTSAPPKVASITLTPVPTELESLLMALLQGDKGQRPREASAVRETMRRIALQARSHNNTASETQTPSLSKATHQLGQATWATVQHTVRSVATSRGARSRLGLLVSLSALAALTLLVIFVTMAPDSSPKNPKSSPPEQRGTAWQTTRGTNKTKTMSPELLVQIDTLLTDPKVERRRRAARAILAAASASSVPDYVQLVAQLEVARPCIKKKGVVREMAELGDARVLPALERLDRTRKGCGFLNMSDCHACLRRVLGTTLKTLRESQ